MSQSQPSSPLQRLSHSLAQAALAARKGLRDGIQSSLFGFSILTSLGAFFFWFGVFVWARNAIWAASMRATYGALPWLPSASIDAWASQAFLWLVAFCLCLIAFGLLVILTIQVVLELLLMPRIQRVCLPQYPSLVQNSTSGHFWHEWIDAAKLWGILAIGLLLWLMPLVGALSFFILATYINVRLLVNDALSDIATAHERKQIIEQHQCSLLWLGLMMAGFLLVPFAGMLMPAVFGASVSHLAYAALVQLREGGASNRLTHA